MKKVIIALLPVILLAGCGKSKEPSARVNIHRLDLSLARYGEMSEGERQSMSEEFRPAIDAWAMLTGSPVDPAAMASSRAVEAFSPDVETRIKSLDDVERELGELKSNFRTELPEVVFPGIFTVVTPYNQSIMIVDTVMLVGINHYLGPDYEGYEGIEDYRRRDKRKEQIPVDIAEALISTNYPEVAPSDGYPTLLSRMLYAGSVAEAKRKLMPWVDEWTVVGFTADEWNWLESNESKIWKTLVERKLLYSVDPMDATRMLSSAPSVPILGQEVPGKAGRYFGYKIVRSYIKKLPGNGSLDFLLSPEFYNSNTTLADSEYAGK